MTPNELASMIDGDGLPTPTMEEVEAFEALIGARLPDDYRTFLVMTPGGVVRGEVTFSLPGEEAGSHLLVDVAGLRSCGSLEWRFQAASDRDTPEGLLSIMTDAGGNDIAVAVRPDRLGEIFFLDHEVAGLDRDRLGEPFSLDHELAGYEGRSSLERAESDEWCYAIRFAASFSELIAQFSIEQD